MSINTSKAFFLLAHSKWMRFVRSPSPLYLGALIFIVLEINFLMKIPPNDYWWYLQLGQDVWHNLSIPVVDSYTYTQKDKPYFFIAWLSSVLFWLFRDPTVATLLHGALPTIFSLLIWQCCRTVGAGVRLTFILTLMVVLIGSTSWAMRPQLFSLPLFAFALLSLLHWQQGRTKWVWFLPVIILCWVNLHGAFPLLFLLAGAALVGGGGDRKTLAVALLASFFTSLCNPQGVMVWHFVFSVLNNAPTQLLGPEWLSPTTALNWPFKLFFCWLLVFPIVTSLSSGKLKLTDWLWFLGFAWIALSGQRYVVWFVAVFAPINAILLTPLANRSIDRRVTLGKPFFNGIVFVLLLLLPLMLLPKIRGNWLADASSAYTHNTPIAAVAWLKLHPEVPGNLWVDLAMSVYIIYALPERPVWIDTRTNLFPMEQWSDYFRIVNVGYDWEAVLVRDKVKLLLLNPEEQPLLIQALTESPDWVSPYQDKYSIIFTLIQK